MSDLDALTRMVAGLDTDTGILAQRMERIERTLAVQEQARMESRLTPGSVVQAGARVGGLDIPTEVSSGASLVSRLRQGVSYGSGRVDPFIGRANVLVDPTFEQFIASTDLTGGGSEDSVGGVWSASSTFTGAGSPLGIVTGNAIPRGEGGRSSNSIRLDFQWDASTGSPVTGEIRLYPTSGHAPSEDTPWLVTSIRVRWNVDDMIAAGLTGTIRLAILDPLDAEVATSEEAIVEYGDGWVEVPLATAYASPDHTSNYRPVLIISVAAASVPGGGIEEPFLVSEWLMNESETEDPTSFTPAIGSWVPDGITSYMDPGDLGPVISIYDSTTGEAVVEMMGDGGWVFDQNAGSVYPVAAVVVSDVSTNDASTPADWLSIPVVSGIAYGLHISGTFTVAHTSQGLEVGTLHGGGRIAGIWQIFGQGAAETASTQAVNSNSTSTVLVSTTSTDAAGGTFLRAFRFDGTFQCTATGTLRFRFRRGGANGTSPGVTIQAGSCVSGWGA